MTGLHRKRSTPLPRFAARFPLRAAWTACFLVLGLFPSARSARGGDEPVTLYASSRRVRSMDPAQAADVPSARAAALVYEGLIGYDYEARPYRLVPLLAEAMPDITEGGTCYTFRLRREARFADDPCFLETGGRGRRLEAADFIEAIKRVADPATGSTGYWVFQGRIAGLDAFRAARAAGAPDPPIPGLEAPDRHTLRIRLTGPSPEFLWMLTLPYAAAVPPEAVRYYGDAFSRQPVGTGPFRLSSWRRHYRMEFRRNPNWTPRREGGGFLADEPSGGVPVERVVWLVMDDPSTRWLAFLAGEIDLYGDISRDHWDAVMDREGGLHPDLARRGLRLHALPGLETQYIGFNMDDSVVGGNRALRRALHCAFDAEAWEGFHHHRVVRAAGPVPPGIAGARRDPAYPFDLERAERLLAEAGYPGGIDPATRRPLELTLEIGRTDPETRESTELLISFFARIGVRLRPSYSNFPLFLERLARREAQLFRVAWVADYPDAQNFLQLFYGPNASPGPNRVNFSQPGYDALYEAFLAAPEGPRRRELGAALAEQVVEEVPWIFLHHPVQYTLAHRWLLGYRPHDFPYGMEKHLGIDPAARAAGTRGRRGRTER